MDVHTLPKLSITLIEKPLAGPQQIRMQKFDSKIKKQQYQLIF